MKSDWVELGQLRLPTPGSSDWVCWPQGGVGRTPSRVNSAVDFPYPRRRGRAWRRQWNGRASGSPCVYEG